MVICFEKKKHNSRQNPASRFFFRQERPLHTRICRIFFASSTPYARRGLWAPLWANTPAARAMRNAPAARVALCAADAGALLDALVAHV